MKKILIPTLVAALTALTGSNALAQITWNGTLTSGTYDFGTAANWVGGVVPGTSASQTMSLNAAGSNSYTINSTSTPANALRTINVAKSTGTVIWNVNSAFNVLDTAGTDLNTFDLNTTTNINSTFTFQSGMQGGVRLIRGGVVNVKNGGTLTVNAAGTTGFVIGNLSGTSTLSVESGGSLAVNSGLFRIGYQTAATSSTGNLTSSGTVTSASGLRVGEGGFTTAGNVNVNAGMFTVSANSTFGVSANGTGTLNVAGGTYTQDNNSTLNIGSGGNGTLNLSSGILNVNTGSSVGQGRVTIAATGTYNQTGGTANMREFVSVASGATRTFTAGTMVISSSINTSNNATFVVGDSTGGTATLNLQGATTTFTNGLTIQSDGILTGTNVNNARGATVMNGTLTPGGIGTAGTLDLATTTTLASSSVLNFELGGTSTANYDRWLSSSTMAFGGTLNLSLINSFNPVFGNSFDLFDFTTATGTFDTLNLASLGGGLSWDTSNLYTTGVISVVPEPTTWALLAGSLTALVIFRRRRSA